MTATVYELNSPPIKNSAFTFHIALYSRADTKIIKTSPTLAAGDITISIDGGNFANIGTLPTQIQTTGILPVTLTPDEMNGNIITVKFVDAAGAEWCDAMATIRTVAAATVAASDPLTAPQTAAAVLDAAAADYNDASSIGEAINNAGSAADPLLNTVPGSYTSGTAGYALGRIGTGRITTTSVVAQSGDVTTYMGDDYTNSDSRALDWTESTTSWPTLTGATISIIIDGIETYTGSVVTGTGSSKKVRLELSAAQTALIAEGVHDFQVIATLATSSRVVTLVEGKWISKRRFAE